jgi:hypothetical protein
MARGAHAEAMVPYAPLNVPKPFGAQAWIVDGPEIRMDYGPFRLPFPTRMVIVRLASGELWVHSPIAPDAALFGAIDALGPVRYLIAPSTLHYWYMADWLERYPAASSFAVGDLKTKAKRPFRIDTVLDDGAAAPWADEIDWLLIAGSVVDEAVFHVRAARLLIVTDLIENFEPARVRGRLLRWLIRIASADGSTPSDLRMTFRGNRREVGRRIRQMLDWRPERVTMAHGRPYTVGAEAELERAFQWALKHAP